MEAQGDVKTMWKDSRRRLVCEGTCVLKYTSRDFERDIMDEVAVMWQVRVVAGEEKVAWVCDTTHPQTDTLCVDGHELVYGARYPG